MDNGGKPSPSSREPRAPAWSDVLPALVLATLGFALNGWPLPLAFNVNFVFGGIFALVAAALLGRTWGLAVALVASVPTWFHWHHPYASVIFATEAFWVGSALRDRRRNLILVDTLYWILAGVPLVVLFYGGARGMGAAATLAVLVRHAANGILNALAANLIVRYLPLDAWLKLPPRPRLLPLSAVVFDIAVVMLLVPATVMIVLTMRRESAMDQERAVALLDAVAVHRKDKLKGWVEQHTRAAQATADLGLDLGVRPSPRLQRELEKLRVLFPDFRSLFLCDPAGASVGFSPPVNWEGRSNVGISLADRPFVHKLLQTREPVYSEVFTGQRAVQRTIVAIAAPILVEGEIQGFGGGAVDLDRLKEQLAQPGGPGMPFLTVLDPAGQVLTSTDPDWSPLMVWADPPGSRFEAVAGPVLRRVPGPGGQVSGMDPSLRARYVLHLPVPEAGWTLIAELPAAPVLRRAYQATIRSLGGLLAVYLAVVILAMAVSRLLAGPPTELAAFSKDLPARIEAGEDLVWPRSRFEEIAQMTSHFRSTAEALGARIREVKDETERRLVSERALIQQSRLAAMGEMISHIAHQWRQPLNALGMTLGNLRDAGRFGELDPAYVERMVRSGDRLIQKMSSTIDDFRDFLRPGKLLVSFSARREVVKTLALVEAGFGSQGVGLVLEPGEDVFTLGVPNEFSHVVVNLLTNARDAILASGDAEGRVRLSIRREGSDCVLRVADTGGGVPPEILERIFEPYFTTKPATGTGLGLYLARMIVHQEMGGTLTVRNLAGGAEFTIRIPAAPAPPGDGPPGDA